MLGLNRRAEDARQIADIFGGQVIMLHEAFDRRRAGVIGIAHAGGDLGLRIKGQALLGAADQIVQMASRRPQMALGLGETSGLRRVQHPARHQRRHILHLIGEFGDPLQGV